MFNWLYHIGIAAIFLTIFAMLLPSGENGGIKRMGMMALGLIFSVVILSPFGGIKGRLENYLNDISLGLYIDKELIDNKAGDIDGAILDKYVENLEQGVMKAVNKIDRVICREVYISINEDENDEGFCNILQARCNISLSEKEEGIIKPIESIDINIGTSDKDNVEDQKEESAKEKEVREVIAKLLNIDRERIIICIGE